MFVCSLSVFIYYNQDGPDAKPLGRGTRIELVLKEDMAEFLEERKVNKKDNSQPNLTS